MRSVSGGYHHPQVNLEFLPLSLIILPFISMNPPPPLSHLAFHVSEQRNPDLGLNNVKYEVRLVVVEVVFFCADHLQFRFP
jgi:hypothetical protein